MFLDMLVRFTAAIIISCHLLSFWVLFHPWRTGYGSESEADDEAAIVNLASDLGRVNKASTKSAVKLQEIGPRMTLQLIKVEEGLSSGGVIFSEYGISPLVLPCELIFGKFSDDKTPHVLSNYLLNQFILGFGASAY